MTEFDDSIPLDRVYEVLNSIIYVEIRTRGLYGDRTAERKFQLARVSDLNFQPLSSRKDYST